MTRTIGLLATVALTLGALATGADAMPIVAPATFATSPAVTLVADGCGPFGHRSHFGYCKPNGGYYGRPAFYGPPRIFGGPGYYARRCFIRETFYGPRRICR